MTLSHYSPNRRKGAVLLVVLAMLALFAVIGLSFVFYAESRATSARIYREAQSPPDVPNALQAAMPAFSQLIYDQGDGTAGVFSALRGHSLARARYGMYYDGNPSDTPIVGGLNGSPYSGVGPVPVDPAIDNLPVVNYSWQFGVTKLFDPERSLSRVDPSAANLPITRPFDPNSRYIGKNVSSTYPDANDMAVAMVNPINGNVLMPSFFRNWLFNNTIYAAAADEFSRQQVLAPPTAANAATNEWNTINGRYRINRPRPSDHAGTFPYPPPNADGTYTGDVQNMPGAAYPYLVKATAANPTGIVADASGNPVLIPKNDSIWVDIGAPVQIWNGKRIKPLFAFLVVPTNSKVNINSAGNPRGPSNAHDSSMGLFPSEVNPNYVLKNSPYLANELQKMKYQAFNAGVPQPTAYSAAATPAQLPAPPGMVGVPAGQQRAMYSGNQNPYVSSTLPPTALSPSVYAPLDWDASAPVVNAMRMQLPGQQGVFSATAGNSAFATGPRWVGPAGANRYGNGDVGDALSIVPPLSPVEQLFNPYLWNPYLWRSVGSANQGRVFTESDLRKLHSKWADDVGLVNNTTLGGLLPISLGSQPGVPGISTSPARTTANASRMNITTRSNSLAIPSYMPMTPSLTTVAPNSYGWAATVAPALPWSTGPTATVGTTINPATAASYATPALGSDFQQNAANQVMMRGYYGNLPPLDLNRPLADYRHALARSYDLPLRPDNMILPTSADYIQWFTNNKGVAPTGAQTTADAPLLATTGPMQLASLNAAMQDRQDFARDIFARLVISTGASAVYNPATGYCTPTVALGTPEFDALRYLAQLAANIVDYIDSDDVSTLFVWNPDPASNLTSPQNDQLNTTSAVVGQRTVFGVEKPKLVLNEAYAELDNNDIDNAPQANQPLELRYSLELMNPNPNDLPYGNETKPNSTATNPMQNAVLYYSLNEQTPTPLIPNFNPGGQPYSSYFVEGYKDGATFNTLLATRTNVMSQSAALPDFRVDFATVAQVGSGPGLAGAQTGYASAAVKASPFGPSPKAIAPVGTKYLPDIMQTPSINTNPVTQGYLVMLPGAKTKNTSEFVPVDWKNPPAPGQYNVPPNSPYQYAMMIPAGTGGGPNPPVQLEMTIGGNQPKEIDVTNRLNELRTNPPTLAVRRLANPYLRPNDPTITLGNFSYDNTLPLNPYLVVDTMSNAYVNDGVRVVFATPPGPPHNPPNKNQRHSWVKANPLTAIAGQVGPPSVEYPTMGFSRQYQPSAPPGGSVNESFFRHNGALATDPENPTPVSSATAARTAVTPFGTAGTDPNLYLPEQVQGSGRGGFDWMTFMDRPLVNQLELLHVPAVPPHQLTLAFGSNQAATPTMQTHVAQWNNQSRLYRALELLQVKPWSYATPIGGRVPGQININLVTDPNVLLALADPQSGDHFTGTIPSSVALGTNTVPDPATGLQFDAIYDGRDQSNKNNQLNPSTTYGKLVGMRGGLLTTPAPPAPYTTPMTSYQVDPVTNKIVVTPVPGPYDRPFRSMSNTATTTGYLPATNGISDTVLNGVFDLQSQKNPFVRNSLLRKVQNNLTTTSDTFEVYLTVGYFEVLNSGPYYSAPNWAIPQLGNEVYKDVEGDMRAKFYAVVDRTNLTVNASSMAQQGSKPIITELAATMPALAAAGVSSMSLYATGFAGGTPIAATPTTYSNPTSVSLQYDMSPSDANPAQIQVGSVLRLDTGTAEELVTVSAINSFDTMTGIATFTVTRTAPGFALVHRAGSRVMNGDAILGNPGPQPAFDPNQTNYRAVMPYFIRLDGN